MGNFVGPDPYGTDGAADAPGDTTGTDVRTGYGTGFVASLVVNGPFIRRTVQWIEGRLRINAPLGAGNIPVSGSFGVAVDAKQDGALIQAGASFVNFLVSFVVAADGSGVDVSLAPGFLGSYLVEIVAGDETSPTNSSVSADADALSTTITLPAGTWTLTAEGGGAFTHDAVMNTLVRLQLDGTDGTQATVGATGTDPGDVKTVTAVQTKIGVVVPAGPPVAKTVKVRFRSTNVGTITCQSSWLRVRAVRTA